VASPARYSELGLPRVKATQVSADIPTKMNRRRIDLVCAALFAAGALALSPIHRTLVGANDFAHLYAGGKLFGTPGVYSLEANHNIERPLIGGDLEGSRFMRPPFVCLFLKPLSLLPYRPAYWIFQTANMGALALFLLLVKGRWRDAGIACLISAPVLGAFINGQELPILIAIATLSLWLARRGHDFSAGLLLALCASKPQLFVLVPVVLLVYRRWRYVAGAALSLALLNAAAAAVAGPDVILSFLKMLREPGASPWPGIMPSVRAIAGANDVLYAALAGAVLLFTLVLIVRVRSFERAFAFALVGSLLMSPHAYMQDAITLLPAAAILLPELAAGTLRTLLRLALLPFPYYLLLLGAPWSFIVPAMVLAVLLAGLFTNWRRTAEMVSSITPLSPATESVPA